MNTFSIYYRFKESFATLHAVHGCRVDEADSMINLLTTVVGNPRVAGAWIHRDKDNSQLFICLKDGRPVWTHWKKGFSLSPQVN